MQNKYKLTKIQIFSILFLIPIIITLTYSKNFFYNQNNKIWDFIISSGVSYIVTFILIIPAYILYKKYPDLNLFASCRLSKLNLTIYTLYFIWASCYTVAIFRIFVLSILPYDSQIFLDTLLMFSLAVYAAFKGINAISRTSVIIAAIVFISLFVIWTSLSSKINVINYPHFAEDGMQCAINGSAYMVSRNFALPVFIILLPISKIKSGKVFLFWNTIIHLVFNIIILINTGALGNYLETQIFPFYAAARVAQIGVFRRLDTIHLGFFVTGILIVITLFFNIFIESLSNIKKTCVKNTLIVLSLFLVLVFGCFLKNSKDFNYFIYDTNLLLILNLVTCLFLPIANLIAESSMFCKKAAGVK